MNNTISTTGVVTLKDALLEWIRRRIIEVAEQDRLNMALGVVVNESEATK